MFLFASNLLPNASPPLSSPSTHVLGIPEAISNSVPCRMAGVTLLDMVGGTFPDEERLDGGLVKLNENDRGVAHGPCVVPGGDVVRLPCNPGGCRRVRRCLAKPVSQPESSRDE